MNYLSTNWNRYIAYINMWFKTNYLWAVKREKWAGINLLYLTRNSVHTHTPTHSFTHTHTCVSTLQRANVIFYHDKCTIVYIRARLGGSRRWLRVFHTRASANLFYLWRAHDALPTPINNTAIAGAAFPSSSSLLLLWLPHGARTHSLKALTSVGKTTRRSAMCTAYAIRGIEAHCRVRCTVPGRALSEAVYTCVIYYVLLTT